MDLNEFLEKKKNSRNRESLLLEKLEDIATLKNKGFADRKICEYLQEQGVSVCQTTLSSFLRKEQVLKFINDRAKGGQNGPE
jgi:arginine repressor